MLLTCRCTTIKWIAIVARWTATDRMMINDLTFSVQAARSRTRISAFLMNTSQTLFTFGADHTFWAAARRSTNVTCLA